MTLSYVLIMGGSNLAIVSFLTCIVTMVFGIRRRGEHSAIARGAVWVLFAASTAGSVGMCMLAASVFLPPESMGFHYGALVVSALLFVIMQVLFGIAFWFAWRMRRNGYVAD